MIELTEDRDLFEKLRRLGRVDGYAGSAFAVSALLIILNYVLQEPLLGVYSSVFLLMGALFLVMRKMKGPNLMFGPNERLRAYTLVMEIAQKSQSYLKVIDLHPSEDMLHVLACSSENVPVQFLTLVINMSGLERDTFKASAKRLMLDRPNIEIRIADKSVFHDRWILTEPHGYHLTQSIKDIGNKIGHFIEMSIEETSECVKVFDKFFVDSKPLEQG